MLNTWALPSFTVRLKLQSVRYIASYFHEASLAPKPSVWYWGIDPILAAFGVSVQDIGGN